MSYINDKLLSFLQAYYDPTEVTSLTDLVNTYLEENPDAIDDMTARFQKLLTDAAAS